VRSDFAAAVQAEDNTPLEMKTGPALHFVPTINPNGTVVLKIMLGTEALNVTLSSPVVVNGTTPADVVVPFVAPSMAAVEVIVPSGQSAVLGGIIREGQTEATKGLPLLGNIPLVGNLFTRMQSDPTRQNLLILITPTIISD
jgi:general secretion pathway protein D